MLQIQYISILYLYAFESFIVKYYYTKELNLNENQYRSKFFAYPINKLEFK